MSSINDLPAELFLRIFSMLDHRHLASAALVCRNWSNRCSQADLWQRLYKQRWDEKTFNPNEFESWKEAYEAQDRRERIGMDMKITREGMDYFLVNEGKLLRFLGTASVDIVQPKEDQKMEDSPSSQTDNQNGYLKRGLVDKLLFFLGDLEYATRSEKRQRAC